ncbi:hypothetical protein KW803_00500 [Candidatus Saccharibacteria bacterium]|nr:hypothetical protein [Candidatus Saccharibacteria bacterium]
MYKLSTNYRLAAEAQKAPVTERWRARENQTLPRKIAEVAIGEILHSWSFGAFINQFKGYRFLDAGWEAVVLESEAQDHVMKVIFNGNRLSKSNGIGLATAYQRTSDIGKKYLGDQWLDTAFCTRRMRLFPSMLLGYGTVALQERVKPVEIFPNPEEISARHQITKTGPELARLLGSIRTMAEETGIYPDVRGSNNIMQVNEDGLDRLKIVDTTLPMDALHFQKPIPGKSKTIEEDILEKLDIWESNLARSLLTENCTDIPTEPFESLRIAVR